MVTCPFFVQANARRKFNMLTKVVLKACSNVTMVEYDWQATSNAAQLAGNIAPKNFKGMQMPPVVTVTMLAALPPSSRPSEPYKFSVTATFAGDGVKNTASATLEINHVRFSQLCISSL